MRYLIYYREDLDSGFKILSKDKESRLVHGKKVSSPSGLSLYQALRSSNQPLKCWECGIEASCFIANKGQNDIVSKPVLDLFAEANGKYVLMTRDHIIPRSLGGINDVKNLRVGCQPCNSARGNSMNEEDLKFMEEHPELIKTREKM